MPDILHEVAIFASPDKVFKALTEQPGIEGWWTSHAVAEPKVGSTVEAHFANGRFIVKMQVLHWSLSVKSNGESSSVIRSGVERISPGIFRRRQKVRDCYSVIEGLVQRMGQCQEPVITGGFTLPA